MVNRLSHSLAVSYTTKMFHSTSGDVQHGPCSLPHLISWVRPPYIFVTTALNVLLSVKRQDVFGGVGEPTSLIDRIISIDDAPEAYQKFDKGEWGKVILDPWK